MTGKHSVKAHTRRMIGLVLLASRFFWGNYSLRHGLFRELLKTACLGSAASSAPVCSTHKMLTRTEQPELCASHPNCSASEMRG